MLSCLHKVVITVSPFGVLGSCVLCSRTTLEECVSRRAVGVQSQPPLKLNIKPFIDAIKLMWPSEQVNMNTLWLSPSSCVNSVLFCRHLNWYVLRTGGTMAGRNQPLYRTI